MANFQELMDKAQELAAQANDAAREADDLESAGKIKEAAAKRSLAAAKNSQARQVAKIATKQSDVPFDLSKQPAPHKYTGSGDFLRQNLIGKGAIDTPGERLGAGVKDAAHAFLAGAARGTVELAGLPGTVSNGIDAGLTGGANLASRIFGGKGNIQRPPGSPLSGEGLVSALGKLTGGATNYQGKNFFSRAAGVTGEFAPGVVAFEGSSFGALGKYAAAPGVASEAAGTATHKTKYEPYARLAASILAPFAVSKVAQFGAHMLTPNAITDPTRKAYLKTLHDAGVNPTAGQATRNTGLQYNEAVTPFGQKSLEAQNVAFTKAAMRHIGSKGQLATPEALHAAYKRIGSKFSAIAKGEPLKITKDGWQKAKVAIRDFHDSVAPASRASLPIKVYEKINNAYSNGGRMNAVEYLDLSSRLSALTKSADPAVRQVSIDLKSVLDAELLKTLTSAGKVDKVAALILARSQYRNFLAIERAASSAGEASAFGVITPARLRTSVAGVFGKRNYTQATDGLPNLARAGTGILKTLPQSGTAPRLAALSNISAGGAPLGAGGFTYMATGNPTLAMGVGAATTLYPMARNGFIGSKIGQRYLSNQFLQSYPKGVSLSGLAGQLPVDATQLNRAR